MKINQFLSLNIFLRCEMRTNKDNLMIKMAIYFNTMIRLSSGKEPKDSPEPWLGNTVLDSLYLYLNFKQVCCYLTVTCVVANVAKFRDGETERPEVQLEYEKPRQIATFPNLVDSFDNVSMALWAI